MLDGLQRNIDYLRVSVTDRCNLRCIYCMPENGVECLSHADILRYEEILRLARIFAGLGVKKIGSPAASRWCGVGFRSWWPG